MVHHVDPREVCFLAELGGLGSVFANDIVAVDLVADGAGKHHSATDPDGQVR